MTDLLSTPQDRLQWVRMKLGLNHKEFAARMGLSPSGYHSRLQRQTKLGKTLALAAQAAFGFRAEWLLSGKEPREIKQHENLTPWESLRLKLSNDDFGLSTRQMFLDSVLLPVRKRQDLMETLVGNENYSNLTEEMGRFLEIKRDLRVIFNEASPTPYLLKPLLLAGGLRESWDDLKLEVEEYRYLLSSEPEQHQRFEVLVTELWKFLDELETLFLE